MLRDHLGNSRAAETAASSVNFDWWQEFGGQASGLGTTFSPSIIGFAAVLQNLENVADNRSHYGAVASAGIAFGVLWLFLAGGIIDRYSRNRQTRAYGFFGASGTFFFRFLRLGLLAAVVYFFLFRPVHRWIFDDFYPWVTRDLTVERTDFLIRMSLYLVFGTLVAGVNLLFDYAKVRAVVEDRRSMLGAVAAAFRFIRRVPARAAGLYLACGLIFVLLLAIYSVVAPGVGSTGLSMWFGFLVGQAFIVARLWTKLLFFAAETVLFQQELAHAEYTAAPLPVWPESPAVEAIVNAVPRA
jgi:hypothetical protein